MDRLHSGERMVARHARLAVEEGDDTEEQWGHMPAVVQEPSASQQVAADLAEWAGDDAVGKKLLADLRNCSGTAADPHGHKPCRRACHRDRNQSVRS